MSNFEDALKYVLGWEGGLVDDADDNGGITNHGISFNFLKRYRFKTEPHQLYSVDDIKHQIENMTADQAAAIYKDAFWNSLYSAIESQILTNYIFDMAVNMGSCMAHKIAQRSSWAFTGNQVIKDDGIFGDKTLGYLNSFGDKLLPCMRSERANYYRICVLKNPDNEKFLNGWFNRAYGIIK